MDHRLRFVLIVLIGVLFDQASKIIVVEYIPLFQSIEIIPGFFDLTHLRNPGGAFGFFADKSQNIRVFVFVFMAFIALFLILWFYKTTDKNLKWLRISYSMIFAGAVGNLIDRIKFGYVVDFLDIYIKDMHWPAFNIADSFISIGMCIIVYHVLFNKIPDF
ncbi:MAG: signal peptidase II [Desulforegulaceae bacterium]|nr:signal peptidase II [Desulforegulaceae bacterium]